MTELRQQAIEILERMPEDKLSFVIQILQGINGLYGVSEPNVKNDIDLDQFVMQVTERVKEINDYEEDRKSAFAKIEQIKKTACRNKRSSV